MNKRRTVVIVLVTILMSLTLPYFSSAETPTTNARIVAIFESGHEGAITVEVGGTFEGGQYFSHIVTPKAPIAYLTLPAGTYRATSYSAEEDEAYLNSDFRIYTTREELTIQENSEEMPTFMVVQGSADFVQKYAINLAAYRNSQYQPVSGVITEDEAKQYIEEDVRQATMPERIEGELVTVPPARPDVTEPTYSMQTIPAEEQQPEPQQDYKLLKIAIGVVLLVIIIVFARRKTVKRKI